MTIDRRELLAAMAAVAAGPFSSAASAANADATPATSTADRDTTAAAAGSDPMHDPPTGRFERFPAFASKQIAPRDVVVWLPDGYDASAERYAVLYMHDGQNVFDPATSMGGQPWAADKHVARLLKAGGVRPTLIVAVANTANRTRDYAPAGPHALLPPEMQQQFAADNGGPPLSDGYVDFLTMELKPFIDAHYRTRVDRDNTVVMGSSMGGLISLYALLRYPDVYGAAGCVSTHWPVSTNWPLVLKQADHPRLVAHAKSTRDYIDQHLPPPGNHRLYFDHGTEKLDAQYPPLQKQVDAVGLAHGYRLGVDWVSREFTGADHTERAWRSRLDIPLTFLLR